MKQLALDLAGPVLPTLENFVPGRNRELLHNLKALAARRAAERFIYLWGEPGCGRTHLLKAAVGAFHHAGASAAYVAIEPGVDLSGALERADCVALDAVDRLDAEAQAAAFRLYNNLRERGAALLASGAAPPVQLKLRADLVTRLGWGLVYQVQALTDAEKAQALTEYAASRGFRLPGDVCDFLLTRLERDMASLLAVVEALDRHSLEAKRPVTVALVRDLLRAAEEQRPDPGPGG